MWKCHYYLKIHVFSKHQNKAEVLAKVTEDMFVRFPKGSIPINALFDYTSAIFLRLISDLTEKNALFPTLCKSVKKVCK